jgi:hypothetical protein
MSNGTAWQILKGADVLTKFIAKIGDRGEHAASDHVALDA